MSSTPRVLVLNAPGINCNIETAFALEQAGAQAEQVHISQLRDGDRDFSDYDILALSGGFSFGDDIASGRILGLELKTRFADDLNRFVETGKAVIGICNGFQVLIESGLLPEGRISEEREKKVSLIHNTEGKFECRWSRLLVEESKCKFIPEDIVDTVVEVPSAHQEGHLFESGNDSQLIRRGQVVFSFVNKSGEPTEEYPDNPNGSPNAVTGICNKDGNILGMMPHPERFVTRTQHPNWRRDEGNNPFGAMLFRGIVNYSRKT